MISVIMPVYNVEKYIAKSIQSVLNQTYLDFELLIVIDGSLDKSKTIAETFQDERIKIFEKPNGGLSDARNYGLERANGEFVYFMDSDDWIEPTLLEENLKILEEENLNLIIFGYVQDDEDKHGTVIKSREIVPTLTKLEKGTDNIILDLHHIGLMGYAWNKIYRKSFLDAYQFRFEKGISLVEDVLFNAPLYSKLIAIQFNTKAYYHYINRPVLTLMKTFHKDSFNLKKRKNIVLSKFMSNWNVSNQKELNSTLMVHGIRYCIHNLFSYKNQLSVKEKLKYVKEMYNDVSTRQMIQDYHAVGLNSLVYKTLIRNQWVLATYLIAIIKK